MQEMEYKILGEASENQIAEWKNRYRKVFSIEVIDGEDKHIGYFSRPSMQTMSAVTKVSKTDDIQGAKVLFDNCFLGGSEALKEDAVLFLECSKRLSELLGSCHSKIKNL